MRLTKANYTLGHIVSSIVMLITLTWLTISIPFVFADQQQRDANKSALNGKHHSSRESQTNPFSNTTEEKTESGVSMLSEYLHESECVTETFIIPENFCQGYIPPIYLAYHGELLSPPPEA